MDHPRVYLTARTVIAGDSWGEIAVPVIQEHPATAFIFAGRLFAASSEDHPIGSQKIEALGLEDYPLVN